MTQQDLDRIERVLKWAANAKGAVRLVPIGQCRDVLEIFRQLRWELDGPSEVVDL